MKKVRICLLVLFINNSLLSQEKKIDYPLKEYEVLQVYANRPNSFRNNFHCADDLIAQGGDKVVAIADGEVVFSGKMDGYGWLIVIDHPFLKVYSLYGHLSSKRPKIKLGKVKVNELIGYIADDDEDGSGPYDGSGRYPYWKPHLHFAIRKGKKADYANNTIDRWMAGYAPKHPNTYGWLDPRKFINDIKNNELKN